MNNDENPKRYDLEDRTAAFAKAARMFVKGLPRTIGNIEDARQLSAPLAPLERTTLKRMKPSERRTSS